MVVTWQTVITIAAVVTATVTITKYYNKLYDFVRDQGKQEKEIKAIKEEQQLMTYGVLACLKGLREQGCDGAVTDAIDKFEKHLNAKAHS
jgi:hypothetical protein